jgi:hypothetical protein
MITQIVMISTIILLSFCGAYFYKKSKKTNFPSARVFSLGLFLIAVAVLFYSIRDIFVQMQKYEIQKNFLVVGGFLHIIGAYLILWFLAKEFGKKAYRYFYYFLFGVLLFGFGLFLTGKFFKLGSEVQKAPFEPFNYYVVRNYLEDPSGNIILWSVIITISILVLSITFTNLLKEKGNKEAIKKGLLYSFGIWFLIGPMIICATLSPVFARIGYLIGAILIYLSTKIKI